MTDREGRALIRRVPAGACCIGIVPRPLAWDCDPSVTEKVISEWFRVLPGGTTTMQIRLPSQR